ncbi:acetoin utilization protein AcuC [Priestia taiwanensis]|uniref:Acetoin utilization protein AcuC n=1 Tax=Priestia taiwanensis TaxID=1347902 RepID=A0A917ET89_9BACI|nr:acetoin utilization protein AcuC [Priestia taiwanensis]MBM7363417.1 acetoin utilization protein AcuC [Priestia taiwanensis]GGE77352.1 acetoin utilization protein AcuC [Priestia taiwanensis]
MKQDAVFVYSPQFSSYSFNDHHPFNQLRVDLSLDLLRKGDYINDSHLIQPRIATDEEILLIHDKVYMDIVKRAGHGEVTKEVTLPYGIGTEDTPIFQNMHEASALLVGGTLTAVDYVLEEKARHALNLGGGLHHGFHARASGFCIYNDSSIAIKYIQQKYKLRVMYVDTDAHHGDGVQWAFYDDPTVCTFSIHETGRYLFPGTGGIQERGQGAGLGYCFNIPVDAFTEDESWLYAYKTAFREIADYFRPDIIITQNGADAHYYDPLTHLSSTIRIYQEIPKLAHELAHKYCDGRWIALGGGGYDMWRVVPRAWSYIWLHMTEQTNVSGAIPKEWLTAWQPYAPVNMPITWEDPTDLYPPIPRRIEIEEKNEKTVAKALEIIRKHSKNSHYFT